MKNSVISLFLLFCLLSCNRPNTYTSYYNFESHTWQQGSGVVFDFNTIGGTQKGEFKIGVRYNDNLAHSTVSLSVKCSNSDNDYTVDTIKAEIPRGAGSNLRSAEILCRTNIEWRDIGRHTITIWPNHTIEGIMSLSIEVDNCTTAVIRE